MQKTLTGPYGLTLFLDTGDADNRKDQGLVIDDVNTASRGYHMACMFGELKQDITDRRIPMTESQLRWLSEVKTEVRTFFLSIDEVLSQHNARLVRLTINRLNGGVERKFGILSVTEGTGSDRVICLNGSYECDSCDILKIDMVELTEIYRTSNEDNYGKLIRYEESVARTVRNRIAFGQNPSVSG